MIECNRVVFIQAHRLYRLALFVDNQNLLILQHKRPAVGKRSGLIVFCRDNFLSFRVKKSPLAVFAECGKAFRETACPRHFFRQFLHLFKFLVDNHNALPFFHSKRHVFIAKRAELRIFALAYGIFRVVNLIALIVATLRAHHKHPVFNDRRHFIKIILAKHIACLRVQNAPLLLAVEHHWHITGLSLVTRATPQRAAHQHCQHGSLQAIDDSHNY